VKKLQITPFEVASRFIGIKEIAGEMNNPHILAMLKLDMDWPSQDEVPWCSAFLNYICWLLHISRSKSLMARSWLDIGTAIQLVNAQAGPDVVILSRGTNPAFGHVGFYAGFDGERIHLLGGNQNDSVNVSPYNTSRVIGVRRLYGEE
jgi:uncharacterized protein (TIGR02594 family)